MSLLKKIIAKKSDSRIETLREAIAANDADRAWLRSFQDRAEGFDTRIRELKVQLENTPTDEIADELLKVCAEKATLQDGLLQVRQASAPEISRRIMERTRQPLIDALAAVSEKLDTEIEAVRNADNAKALELDVSPEDVESPLLAKLKTERASIAIWKERVAEASDWNRFSPAIALCLPRD